jgi:drug/metabolite transporter (DMT)-like permease
MSVWSGSAILGPFGCFLASATWALGSGNYSKISRDHSPFSVNFTRAVFALPFFILAASFFELKSLPGLWDALRALHPSTLGWLGLSMFASYGFGDAIFLLSARSLGVPGALAISSIYPIWTAAAAYFFRCEELALSQCVGLFVAVLGVITVILSEEREYGGGEIVSDKKAIHRKVRRGVCLALVSSVFWAMNSYSVSQGGKDVGAFFGNSIRMALAIPICAITSTVFGALSRSAPREKLLLPVRTVRKYGWVFFIETFGGSYFYVYGLSHSPLALASTLTSLAPVLVVPVALALKIERFSIWRTFGIFLVVLGLCLLVGAH